MKKDPFTEKTKRLKSSDSFIASLFVVFVCVVNVSLAILIVKVLTQPACQDYLIHLIQQSE